MSLLFRLRNIAIGMAGAVFVTACGPVPPKRETLTSSLVQIRRAPNGYVVAPLSRMVSTVSNRGDSREFLKEIAANKLAYGSVFRVPTAGIAEPVDCQVVHSIGIMVLIQPTRSMATRAVRFQWHRNGQALNGSRFRRYKYPYHPRLGVRFTEFWLLRHWLPLRDEDLVNGLYTVTVSHLGEEFHRETFELRRCEELDNPLPSWEREPL